MVRVQQRLGVSERRACEVLGQASEESDEAALRADVVKVSGRYLSFVEREEIAVLHHAGRLSGVRRCWRSPGSCVAAQLVDDLARTAAERSNNEVETSSIEPREYNTIRPMACRSDERRCWRARPKVAKLAANGELRQYVQDRLDEEA